MITLHLAAVARWSTIGLKDILAANLPRPRLAFKERGLLSGGRRREERVTAMRHYRPRRRCCQRISGATLALLGVALRRQRRLARGAALALTTAGHNRPSAPRFVVTPVTTAMAGSATSLAPFMAAAVACAASFVFKILAPV